MCIRDRGENQLVTVTAASDNPGLIPHPMVNYPGSGSTATLTLAPTPSSNGVALVSVIVNDAQGQSNFVTRSFAVTVNGAPRFLPVPDQTTPEDTSLMVPFS